MLVGLGSAALAVGFFWLWQRLQHPLLAYIDAIVYGGLALLATFVLINRWLRVPGYQREPTIQGLQAPPNEANTRLPTS